MGCEYQFIPQLNRRDTQFGRKLGAIRTHGVNLNNPAVYSTFTDFEITLKTSIMRLAPGQRDDFLRQIFTQYFGTGVAKGLLCRRIEFDNFSTAIHGDDTIKCRFENGTFEGFTFTQFLVRTHSLSDVLADANHPDGFTIFVLDDLTLTEKHTHFSIRADDTFLHLPVSLAIRLFEGLLNHLSIFYMDLVEECLKRRTEFLWLQPIDLIKSIRPGNFVSRNVPLKTPDVTDLFCIRQHLFTLLNFFLCLLMFGNVASIRIDISGIDNR